MARIFLFSNGKITASFGSHYLKHFTEFLIYQNRSRVRVDEVFVVTDEQVPENSGLVEVAEADHVLHTLDGCRMHRLDSALRCQPLLFAVVVNNLKRSKGHTYQQPIKSKGHPY